MAARRFAPTTLSFIKRGSSLLALVVLAGCAGAFTPGDLARGDDAFHEGRYDEAGRFYARAAASQDARALNGLAAIERLEGRYDKAANLYRRTAGILEKAPVPAPRELRAAYFDLAQTSSLAGHVQDAVTAYRRCLELANKEAAGGEELAGQLSTAGQFFSLQTYFVEAVKCYRQALAIHERLLPLDSAAIGELNRDIDGAKEAMRRSNSDVVSPGATK
jgi:tetratricopeptide (TPR) repeat protein